MGDATDVDRIPILFEPMWLTHRKPEMDTSFKLSDPDASISTSSSLDRQKEPSIGTLECRLRILCATLMQLDLSLMRDFNATNSPARSIALSRPRYRDIPKHSPDPVATLCLTGVSS